MLCEKSLCVGCGACHDICPFEAIKMVKDLRGFQIPKINESSCISCGKCEMVCPVLNKTSIRPFRECFVGASTSRELILNSSSGGIFSAIAEWVLDNGGVVFGAALSDDFYSLRCLSTEESTMNKLRKSKYIESEADCIYKKIHTELLKNRLVLFCSTPCKISAANRYLNQVGAQKDKLLLVDFACHGVSSPLLWERYLKELEIRYSSKCKRVDFRCKKYGWDFSHFLKIDFENGKTYYGDSIGNGWYRLYIKGIGHREACYSCDFMKHSEGDLTLGDFWNEKLSVRSTSKGSSLILSRTVKGSKMIVNISSELSLRKLDYIGEELFKKKGESEEKIKKNKLFFQGFLQDEININKLAKQLAGTNLLKGWLMRVRIIRNISNGLYRLLRKGVL